MIQSGHHGMQVFMDFRGRMLGDVLRPLQMRSSPSSNLCSIPAGCYPEEEEEEDGRSSHPLELGAARWIFLPPGRGMGNASGLVGVGWCGSGHGGGGNPKYTAEFRIVNAGKWAYESYDLHVRAANTVHKRRKLGIVNSENWKHKPRQLESEIPEFQHIELSL